MATKLYRDGKGRWRVEGIKRYASRAEVQAWESGDGDVNVTVNAGTSAPRAPRARHAGGGGGGGFAGLLPVENVVRPRIEAGWDVIAGLLDGLAELAQAPSDVRAQAQAMYARAHTSPTPQGVRDERQYQAGKQLAEVLGYVAVYAGWTPETWAAVMPRQLATIASGGSVGSLLNADDIGDEIAGGLASSALSDALEVAGAAVGTAVLPGAGTAVGGLLGNLAGTILGRQAGVAGSNYFQGEAPVIGEQMSFLPAAQVAAGIP